VSVLLGAETIYSPFALQAFAETVLAILDREKSIFQSQADAWVAAKRLYFGVGGSLDDFVDVMQERRATVNRVREEADGVRRGVVHCIRP
jgi:protein-histidine N-methyltransferase